MNKSVPWRTLVVESDERSERLDVWLAANVERLSRRRAKGLIEAGDVTVNGRRAVKSDRLKPGSEVAVWSEPSPEIWSPKPDPDSLLEVAYEDDHLVVVVKPAGVPSVPLSAEETKTLANAVVARFSECAEVGRSPGDAGLVQRLDRETSGLVLVARSQDTHNRLVEMQRRGGLRKRYLALVSGAEGDLPRVVDFGLASAGPGGSKVKMSAKGPALWTELREVNRHGDWLLVEATIRKGFRHQVRAHLAGVGFPIAGDALYGGGPAKGVDRLFLHASRISFVHPEKGVGVTVDSPLPDEFAAFLEPN